MPHDDPASGLPRGHFRVTLDEQASFVVEAFALALSAGVERFAIYKMIDGNVERHEPYGLVRNDRTLRPAYLAFQVVSRYLDQPANNVTRRRIGDVNLVILERSGTRTTVVWNGGPNSATAAITPAGTRAVLVDKYGSQTTIDPRQNSYSIPLAPATANTVDGQPNVYIVGGNPLILVEDGVGDAVSDAGNSLFYPITGYHISGKFLDYFQKRGGLRTFGYPISRRLVLLGSEVQFFQRQVMQVRPDGSIGTVNILDSDLMPYTQINGAVLPSIDKGLQTAAPAPGTPAYTQRSLQFVKDRVPNNRNAQPVNFLQTFNNTVRPEEAFPGSLALLNLLPGINLELWGLPTSAPMSDPANGDFAFQRFQRGVMHYDRRTGASQGVLLAAFLQAIITGRDLPADLAAQAKNSRFYLQYANDKPRGLNRPEQLSGTNLRDAFERESYGQLPPVVRP